ncbi:pyruvate, water dikinase regulatory protein [Cohaesibacter celericrescens]|uniref:Putative pyruvate, phosphate dikinase regulatory protein n=1 Tax=Cohaesibacter celericrescens TaxID=2067669 RepID=A0A2N5XP30_9HYPH|nr:pyruvate, water dikinase regulatory protein [Cohaesibacter celericrescens]PLW76254.1 phosphoenolpyruvate synthase regulatory protein [Cohaesibacter celericrescens]
MRDQFFHLHMISDATGDTLRAVGRAASAQYSHARVVEHIHSMVRNDQQLSDILEKIELEPGIVLYTLVNSDHAQKLETACQQLHIPVYNVLSPIFDLFQSYLGSSQTGQIGAQHSLDASYFQRIEAMNFTMLHDDGLSPHSIGEADVVILGISRTSKTPTSVYLAQRGLRVANIPIVPDIALPKALFALKKPFIICLIASSRHILQIRHHRILGLPANSQESDYLNRSVINEEIAYTRRICQRNQWPILDVTRKSIEETSAEILKSYQQHCRYLAEMVQNRR